MIEQQEISNCLDELLMLLKKEKEILIEDDPLQLIEIINSKKIIIDKIESFNNKDKEIDMSSFNETIAEITELQETNLLLTKQAMSFHDMIINELKNQTVNNSNTYSSKGTLDLDENISLINQSV